ncbi:MAG: ATP-dependent DNA helicase RecG [Candidatus Nealsonbacteria bacterium]|nr:ATP-dependent DNA helicase RecG [Candidatus Nealsonbacteria bacterium]
MYLSTPIEEIPRVGPQYQKKLKKLGIETVGQLIFHFPHRYEDFSDIIPISKAEPGKIVCVQGKITEIRNIRIFRRRMYITEAKINDESGGIRAVWFNQPYLINTLKKSDFVFLAGKMVSKNGKKYLSSPAYEKIPAQFVESLENGKRYDSVHTGRIIPVYPETEGMSSRWLRFIIKPLLTKIKDKIPETLPKNEVLKKHELLPIKEAIWQIHFPDTLEKAELAKKRFVFEELFDLSLAILSEKIRLAKEKAILIPINLESVKKFVEKLPFKLTLDQRKAAWQILKDLEKTKPMNRLLDGDVGSGKTVVATMAALNTAKSELQIAFMVPTEILAKQHFKTISTLLKGFRIKIGLITGKENFSNGRKIKRKEIIEKIKQGKVDILIGTHALIQEKVKFKKLGLVIIDEQHRFGIEQRAKLCRKQKYIPHLLSMSATPIPRTLTLTIYGDLDLSLIKEMPKGRKKIITEIIRPEKRQQAYDFIRKEVKSGKQVFVACPRIEPSTKNNGVGQALIALSWAEVKAVKEEYEKLSKNIFPDLNIGMLHGKMKTEEKEKVLKSFENRKTDILVSTSVIEVGIDFPNATIMMIEGADKFGLAQLHQFRGRVGRSKYQSYCFLLSEFPNNPRLKAMIKFQDGFELAEKDLKLRGPGDLTGQRQWGVPDFVMASLKNIELVEKTRIAAKEVLQIDPELKNYPGLRTKLKEFQQRIHLE